MSICNFLKCFYDITKANKGRNAITDNIFLAIDYLMEMFE